ncbi:GNAT family N-acetyltransferase [Allokutzneria sp. A3M-2-11 16]|uniref:GNAT family N-acetyltransferase n=1 Tax=Allokutzneria sp. A3M-2-11 16 TaxID=2962043 RepID=UPI0020B81364|nr:GNAT family N-acetyltransferase [Allokutzneria sp. A3M-2-11 16]MCP3804815.1 GNAT family N-acetyltransferase [Allokutzneria sp. A3M-2-11 16]
MSPANVPALTDGVVTLRAHRLSDVDDVVVQCADPETQRWTAVPSPYRREDAVKFVSERAPAVWADGSEALFAIEAEHSDGRFRFSGSIGLRDRGEGVYEIAFGVHPGVRGRGVCGRAARLVMDWGIRERAVTVVLWRATVGNWPSRRVALATGFSMDGTAVDTHRGELREVWIGSRLGVGDAGIPVAGTGRSR